MSKIINLLSLTYRNFKGLRDFKFEPLGDDAKVYGDNATFKTTLFDGFSWLLFDKDSTNKSDFAIKTLDDQNKVIPGLEHEIEGVLSVDGKKKTFRKVYTEKWTKKRGSALQEFTGHTTTYYVDTVPVGTKKEYDDAVSEIVKEDIFKLLTNPSYFSEVLDKKKRRDILLKVCGDVSDEDVIASNKELAKLTDILGDLSVESHGKIIKEKRTNINKELEKIPVRIDEVQRAMPETDGLDEKKLQAEIASLKSTIEAKEAEAGRIRSGAEMTVKENQIRVIEGELQQIKNDRYSNRDTEVTKKATANHKIISEIGSIENEIKIKQQQITRNMQVVAIKDKELESIRQKWHEANGKEFLSTTESECPACGQPLPEERVKEASEKALANFNREKSERIESINAQGKAAKEEVDRLKKDNIDLEAAVKSLTKQLESKKAESQALAAEIDKLQADLKNVGADPVYVKKSQEKAAIEQEMQQLNSSSQVSVDAVNSEIAKLRYTVGELEEDIKKFSDVIKSNKRIDELKTEERRLAAEYEKLEQELYLTEEFTRTKVSMLESKINSKFKYVRFKLFDQQVNGGLEEMCEPLYRGVPYSKGLNRAAQTNVGLDIINTLSDYYGFTPPIFIDNAEGVTKMIKTNGQRVCLIVSEPDKKLRVETKSKTQEAV